MYSGTDLSLRDLLIHFTSHELQCCCRLFQVFVFSLRALRAASSVGRADGAGMVPLRRCIPSQLIISYLFVESR